MIFNSLTFFYFFATTIAVLSLVPQRMRLPWILLASMVFYMSWSPSFLVLLLLTAVVDYKLALIMGRLPTKEQRKPWLVLSLVFSLGSLAFFKYSPLVLDTINHMKGWWGLEPLPWVWNIGLPLGISFYTFETVSYAVDVYRGELQPKKSFFEYLSFLMFFPKLIAGPIVRASELLHQFHHHRKPRWEDGVEGMNLLAKGFFKKVMLADHFAPFVENVFANPGRFSRMELAVAIYGYSMQVYFDFSAYSDMARGCARWMGFELPQNFNQPYLAVSISDFWRRWHMTLSRWLRDYFYIPMGGSAGGFWSTNRNLFLTMLVGGLWHGANWTFVIWGALNGSFLVVERIYYQAVGRRVPKVEEMGFTQRWVRRFVVFHLITLTRVFFRAPTLEVAGEMFKRLWVPLKAEVSMDGMVILIPLLSLAYVLGGSLYQRGKVLGVWPRWSVLNPKHAWIYGLLWGMYFWFGASNAEFIYFQF